MGTFTWNILQLDTLPSFDGKINVVHTVHWELIYTEGSKSVSAKNCTVLGPPPANESYAAYDSLSKEKVVSWVENTLAVNNVLNGYKSALQNKINKSGASPNIPWS